MVINFEKIKNPLGSSYQYEAYGEFRKNTTFIRISKQPFKSIWSLIVFYDESPKGSVYCECKTLKDAKETAQWHFGL